MELRHTNDRGALNIAVTGELGHAEAIAAMARITAAIDAALPVSVALDLSGLSFADSSGIAVLLRAQRQCEGIGASFVVRGTPPQAMRVFDAARLGRFVTFQP
ncbi:MAG: hypothetical protein ABT01_07070 [Clostridium sp. SCN 57-10]|nr:MAG: hypothetical protein ABT01_07070 [Clostridium sp. SCN 57-10]